MKKVIGQQGEVRIAEIDAIPANIKTKPVDKTDKGWIISHSENGNHHLLVGGEVIERTDNVPLGMRIFYAMLDGPSKLIQDAPHPHGGFDLVEKFYEFRISRERKLFSDQIRRVAD